MACHRASPTSASSCPARLRVTFGAARVVMAVIVQWTAGLCCSDRTFVNEKVILCSEGTW